ncbi:copper amine oxidase N-terminal domain-containing protein [Desulforamulus ruminis]|uniref:Copper amine oxidase-like domain-containing protein n=1 Tax=Desulforamulus ruminis (strain ATCC 23193 / DSM 2154 / NCIMB 8452 / DL) TaxID=696281 RepID=F6DP50_DESRL|nr:copper amine oxidase N-terminal domain-containing protein [Desulforamulus ruminis]AEG61879.1 copper amine oxidase-like domain-containing protein [Desulforamulus ruminis DSM 2154]
MKKLTIILLILCFSFSFGRQGFAQQNIEIRINGSVTDPTTPARIIERHVMVPLRFIAESLNAEVNWNDLNPTVEIISNTPDYKLMKLNGKQTTWPYWEQDGQVYMEVHNYIDLMRRYYSNYYSIGLGSSHISFNNRNFKYTPIKRGEFSTVSLQILWERGDFVPFIWDSKNGNLLVEKIKDDF